MTPQTVNAYYNPMMNEIVFPAAFLQPPYFNPDADDAANYGGVGRTIGHEISHGFDDSGSQFDGDGNLRDWWTADDHKRFDEKTKALVAQFDAYSPGARILRQRQADAGREHRRPVGPGDCLQGLPAIAGRQGSTGDRRHDRRRALLPELRARRSATRRATKSRSSIVKSDPHSPDQFRVNGPLSNLDAFYKTYKLKPGDKLYRAPQERVSIW